MLSAKGSLVTNNTHVWSFAGLSLRRRGVLRRLLDQCECARPQRCGASNGGCGAGTSPCPRRGPDVFLGAFCLVLIRTSTFCQLVGFPSNHVKVKPLAEQKATVFSWRISFFFFFARGVLRNRRRPKILTKSARLSVAWRTWNSGGFTIGLNHTLKRSMK